MNKKEKIINSGRVLIKQQKKRRNQGSPLFTTLQFHRMWDCNMF